MEILPTILTENEDQAKSQIKILQKYVKWGHLDVIDGVFIDMETVKPQVLVDSKIKWEIHLMVEEPVIWIERCLGVKAERIIGQIENMSDQNEFVETVMRADVEVGLAIDLNTQFEQIDEMVLPWINRILVMGVKAGNSGQKFEEDIYQKIVSIWQIRKNKGYSFVIEVDGGVSLEVAGRLKELGVESVAMNKALWEGEFEQNLGSVLSVIK